jgi:hypothetical protein
MPGDDFTPLPANHAKPFAPIVGGTGKLAASVAIFSLLRSQRMVFSFTDEIFLIW